VTEPSPTPCVVVRTTTGGPRWPDVVLGHGEAPVDAAARAVGSPVVLLEVLAADVVDGVLRISLEVRADPSPAGPASGPPAPPSGAVAFRRLAAYALVVHDAHVLLTQLAEATPAPGAWTLPGGGIDPGESPLAAVVREVHEETGHELLDPRLLDVHSSSFVGRAPSGRLEDFHGIGLVYRAAVSEVREPRVLEVGGSTAAAAWVPVADVPGLPMGRRGRWVVDALARAAQEQA
jgi:8-oxo-dGTP diphosphatase